MWRHLLLLLTLVVFIPSCQQTEPAPEAPALAWEAKQVSTQKESDSDRDKAAAVREQPYEVLRVERGIDINPLSWRLTFGVSYHVLLNQDPEDLDLKAIARRLLEEAQTNKPFNGFRVLFHLDREGPALGSIVYAPNGTWENAGEVEVGQYEKMSFAYHLSRLRKKEKPGKSRDRPLKPEDRVENLADLPVEKRKTIFKEIILAEEQSWTSANRNYPPRADEEKNIRFKTRAEYENKKALGRKYGLTLEQIQKIDQEGLEKDWAFPEQFVDFPGELRR